MKKRNYKKMYEAEQEKYLNASFAYRKLNKRFNFWIILVFLFLLSLIGLFVYALYYIPPNYPSYHIYKNECHNETKQLPCVVIDYKNKSIYACPQYYIEVNESVISNASVQLPQEEVCNKTEVDEIQYNQEINCDTRDYYRKDYPVECITINLCVANCWDYFMHYIPQFKDDLNPYDKKEKCLKNCYIKNITKKDITKEWFANNCECLLCGNGLNYKGCKEGECSKYKCGNYLVEAK